MTVSSSSTESRTRLTRMASMAEGSLGRSLARSTVIQEVSSRISGATWGGVSLMITHSSRNGSVPATLIRQERYPTPHAIQKDSPTANRENSIV